MKSEFFAEPITVGDSREFVIDVLDRDGAAVDLSGWIVRLSLSAPGISILIEAVNTATVGRCVATLAPADTSGLDAPARLTVEVQASPPAGGPYTVIRGEYVDLLTQAIMV